MSKLRCLTSSNWFFEMMKLLPVFQRTQEEHKEENDEDTHHLQRVTAILELLQYKINIEEPHRLLPTLFATLTRYIIHSQSQNTQDYHLVTNCWFKSMFKMNYNCSCLN